MSVVLETEQQPTKPPKRVYSDREKAEALELLEATGSLTVTAKQLGIPDATISGWKYGIGSKSPGIPIIRSEIRQGVSLDLASDFEEIASLSCQEARQRLMNPKKAAKIPFIQLMSGAGISVDKSQLIRGLPTSISASVMSEDERRLKLAEVLERLEAKAIEGQVVTDSSVSEMAQDVDNQNR
jgi:hypothetical protein